MHTTVIAPRGAGFFGAGAAAGAANGAAWTATGLGGGGGAGAVAAGAMTGVAGGGAAAAVATAGVAVATGGAVGAGSIGDAAAVITGGAVTAVGGAPDVAPGGDAEEPGCVTALVNAARADENGPELAAGPVAPPATEPAVPVPALELAFGDGAPFVDQTIALTTPAMRSAMEQERAATTHLGGRRLKRCAVIVRLS